MVVFKLWYSMYIYCLLLVIDTNIILYFSTPSLLHWEIRWSIGKGRLGCGGMEGHPISVSCCRFTTAKKPRTGNDKSCLEPWYFQPFWDNNFTANSSISGRVSSVQDALRSVWDSISKHWNFVKHIFSISKVHQPHTQNRQQSPTDASHSPRLCMRVMRMMRTMMRRMMRLMC